MDEQWQAVRADMLELTEGDSTKWVRVKTLVHRAYERGLTTGTGPVLAGAIGWAVNEGLAELREGPPMFGAVRLTAAGAR